MPTWTLGCLALTRRSRSRDRFPRCYLDFNHSTLEQATRKFIPRWIRRVLGTKRVIAEEVPNDRDGE